MAIIGNIPNILQLPGLPSQKGGQKSGNFDVQEVEDAVTPRQTSPGRERDSKDLETDINLGIWEYHSYIMVSYIMVISWSYPHVSTSPQHDIP